MEDLRLFRDGTRGRSLSRGGAWNGVSQPATSQRPHEMEKGLGVTRLDRGMRPAAITPARLNAAPDVLRARIEGSARVASIYSVGLSDMTRLRPDIVCEAVVNGATGRERTLRRRPDGQGGRGGGRRREHPHRRGRKFNQGTQRFLELLLEDGKDEGDQADGEQVQHDDCNT